MLALADREDGKWIRPWKKERVKHGLAIYSRPRRTMTLGISRIATVASFGSDTAVKAGQGKCTPMDQALTHPPHYQATHIAHKKNEK